MENGTATQDEIVARPKAVNGHHPLTERQRRFIQEYMVDLNATAAAKRAGYSPKWAYNVGPSVRRIPKVAAEIDRALAERAERTQITADRVVIELAKVAFGDPRRLLAMGSTGATVREFEDLTDTEAALISEITETGAGDNKRRRVKLHCKMTALTALAKHLGLFNGHLKPPEHAGHAGIEHREDPRERLARKIARISARLREEESNHGADRA